MTDFDLRIRELQAGKASKFAPFVDENSGRRVEYPKEDKPSSGYGQLSNYPTSKYQSPQRDGHSPTSYGGSSFNQNFPDSNNYRKASDDKAKGSPTSPLHRRKRSHSPPPSSSSSSLRKRDETSQSKHRKKSFSPHKSKYRSKSPVSKHAKDPGKKGRHDSVQNERKKSPPHSSRLGPGIDSNLIVIPRRKDEGTTPIFDRPEIPVYTIRDDPSLIAEGYFDKEDMQRGRSMQMQSNSDYSHEQRDTQRPPSPTVTFSSTGLEKLNFPNSAPFFERRKEPQIVSTTLGEIHDRMRDSIQQSGQLPSSDLRLALERKQLSPLADSFTSDLLSQETIIYEREKMSRAMSEERRPVKERLGGKKDEFPDFRKEVDLLNQADPLSTPKGRGYFEHDDREDSLRKPFPLPPRRPFRGGYRGRGFMRGRGYMRGSFNPRGRSFRGSSYGRGLGRGYARERDRWTHDKFEDQDSGSSYKKLKKTKEEKSSKKEKKSKKSDRERRDSHK